MVASQGSAVTILDLTSMASKTHATGSITQRKRARKAKIDIAVQQTSLLKFVQSKPASKSKPSVSVSSPLISHVYGRNCRRNEAQSLGSPLRQNDTVEPTAPSRQLWVDKHRPRCVEELAVHKTCIEKVRSWIQDSLHGLSQRQQGQMLPAVLVLSGPTGAGKTVLVQTVADEIGLTLAEWRSPHGNNWGTNKFAQTDPSSSWAGKYTDTSYQHPLSALEHFLLGTARYQSLPITTIGAHGIIKPSIAAAGAAAPLNALTSFQSLILVDELPHLSTLELQEQFRALVKRFSSCTRTPAIFIVSTHRSPHFDGLHQKSDETRAHTYFPQESFHNVALSQIKCIAANKTNLEKMLRRILAAEEADGTFANDSSSAHRQARLCHVKAIVEEANGDIRTAINMLQFVVLGADLPFPAQVSTNAVSRRTNSKQSREG
eukprot:SAG31_NODE_6999_length_1823_cov_1.166957_1_plen_431_part_01